MLLSIIIPVFNEEKTIEELLDRVSKVVLNKNIAKEIIVIDDSSTDKTKDILKKLEKKYKFKRITHEKNSGKGAAIKSGLRKSKGEWIIIQDADLEYDPAYYNQLLEPLLSKKALIVYGNRFANYPLKLWGKDKTIMPHHWIANKLLTSVTNVLYGSKISDMETGYKIFNKEILKNLKLNSKRFEIEVELTAKVLLNGHKIHEVPIKTNPRTHKEGKKISWKDGVAASWALIKYRFKP